MASFGDAWNVGSGLIVIVLAPCLLGRILERRRHAAARAAGWVRPALTIHHRGRPVISKMNAATISPGVRDVQLGAFLVMGSSNRPQMLPYWTETPRKSVVALQRRFSTQR